MANDWYVSVGNAEHGPMSAETLKGLAAQGKITPDTFVKKGQVSNWVPAGNVKGLFVPSIRTAGQPHPESSPSPMPSPPPVAGLPSGEGNSAILSKMELQTRQWAMIVHFSLYVAYIVPLLGFVVPFAIWQVKKVEFPGINAHGKAVMNWFLSVVLFLFVLLAVRFLFTPAVRMGGICDLTPTITKVLAVLLGIAGLVSPIIGGLMAKNGDVLRYPFSIRFFK